MKTLRFHIHMQFRFLSLSWSVCYNFAADRTSNKCAICRDPERRAGRRENDFHQLQGFWTMDLSIDHVKEPHILTRRRTALGEHALSAQLSWVRQTSLEYLVCLDVAVCKVVLGSVRIRRRCSTPEYLKFRNSFQNRSNTYLCQIFVFYAMFYRVLSMGFLLPY